MRVLLPIFLILLGPAWVGADQIVLRSVARVEGPVRLKDVADLYGPEAQRLADAVVAPVGVSQITMDRVRDALVPHGPRWAELIFKGAMQVRLGRPAVSKVRANHPNTPASAASKVVENASIYRRGQAPTAADTVRQQVEQWVLNRVDLAYERIKIDFDKSDDPLLARRVGNARLEVQPMGRNRIGRLPMTVRVYDQDRLVIQGRVVCQVQVERQVVVAARSLPRGQTVMAEDVHHENRWIGSFGLNPADRVEQVVGQRLERRKQAGAMLGVNDLRAAVVVRRGQRITLKCFSGPLVIQTTARAMEHGQMDQFILVRNEQSKQQVRGRITGPQEVTVILDDAVAPAPASKEQS